MITIRETVLSDAAEKYTNCWGRGWRYAYSDFLPHDLIARTVSRM